MAPGPGFRSRAALRIEFMKQRQNGARVEWCCHPGPTLPETACIGDVCALTFLHLGSLAGNPLIACTAELLVMIITLWQILFLTADVAAKESGESAK